MDANVMYELSMISQRLDRIADALEAMVQKPVVVSPDAGQPGGPAVIHQPTLPVCGGNPIPGSVDGSYTELPEDETCLQCGCLRSAHYCGTVCPVVTPDQP